MKIGIIAGSTRQGRNSAGVAHWVAQGVDDHADSDDDEGDAE